jgi:hypothetical protein
MKIINFCLCLQLEEEQDDGTAAVDLEDFLNDELDE